MSMGDDSRCSPPNSGGARHSADYLVSAVTVTGSFKQWSEPTRDSQGVSGGSEISLTVVPPPDSYGWDAGEAEVIGFEVRMKIHVMLMADAQMRGVVIPASARNALVSYRQKVQTLREGLNGHASYQDAEVPSPAPSLVEDTHIETPENM